jgi:hypothetical protein
VCRVAALYRAASQQHEVKLNSVIGRTSGNLNGMSRLTCFAVPRVTRGKAFGRDAMCMSQGCTRAQRNNMSKWMASSRGLSKAK